MKKKISMGDACKLWAVCWLGNLAGGIVLAMIYRMTGLGEGSTAGAFMAASAAAKMSTGPAALFARGILCNYLVCLATWCGFRTKSDTAKLIMVFWCLYAFFTTGFEHSVANMTLFAVTLLNPAGQSVSLWGAAYNLVIVTLGNILGGVVFVALPYYAAQAK